jgi:hypothetical protein
MAVGHPVIQNAGFGALQHTNARCLQVSSYWAYTRKFGPK